LPEFQAKRLTVRELPNDEDRKTAAAFDKALTPQQCADIRVLERDAPDLKLATVESIVEAMQILEARKRAKQGEGSL
jgi:hypothetical protein